MFCICKSCASSLAAYMLSVWERMMPELRIALRGVPQGCMWQCRRPSLT
jgi:hypothetical protein